jgi:hypothetical protein
MVGDMGIFKMDSYLNISVFYHYLVVIIVMSWQMRICVETGSRK